MRQAGKKKKKILLPNFVRTRPNQENSEKNSKKIEKIKKPLSNIIFSQNGMRQAEKEGKKFYSRMPFKLDPDKKIPKNSKKIEKIKKPLSDIIFIQNGMRQAEKEGKKNLLRNAVRTRPGQENSEKNSKKIEKI